MYVFIACVRFSVIHRGSVVIPSERAFPPKTSPIFFGAALQDYVCVAETNRRAVQVEDFKEHNVTIRDFDTSHWLILSKADEVCRELESWIESAVIGQAGQ